MFDLYFGFVGTLGRWKFFLANIGLVLISILIAVILTIPLVLSGTDIQLAENVSQPGLALVILIVGIFFTWCSAALFSKRLGWKGQAGHVSWIYMIAQSAQLIVNVFGTAFGVNTPLTGIFPGVCLFTLIIACTIQGKAGGDDFDEDALEAKINAEMRQQYGSSRRTKTAAASHRSAIKPASVPASVPATVTRGIKQTSFGRR